jgi:hypothetical protein
MMQASIARLRLQWFESDSWYPARVRQPDGRNRPWLCENSGSGAASIFEAYCLAEPENRENSWSTRLYGFAREFSRSLDPKATFRFSAMKGRKRRKGVLSPEPHKVERQLDSTRSSARTISTHFSSLARLRADSWDRLH